MLITLGCGPQHAYDTVPVEGTIRYSDDSVIPAARIELRFIPQAAPINEKTRPKMGVVEVNVADGSFGHVNTYEFGDGLIVGKHRVIAMSMDERSAFTDAIDAKYRELKTTPLEIDTVDTPLRIVIQKD